MSKALTGWWKEPKNPEFAGYTRLIFKREVLGECKVRAFGKMRERFWNCLRAVKDRENQPYHPRRPSGETERFYQAVAEQMRSLGLNPRKLQIFTAVGSGLEKHHGVSGLFAFDGIMVAISCGIDISHEDYPNKVIVNGDDMLNGYASPALDIAMRIKSAKNQGLRGVVNR